MSKTNKADRMEVRAEPGRQEIVLTRVFDAPRELVFEVYTDPAHIPHWWGPRRLVTTVEAMDVRPGGAWRFLQRDADGNQFAFHGVYHEVVPPERVVSTFEFEGMPGHVVLETTTLEDLGGRTRLVTRSVFQSVEDRDGMVGSGMEEGAAESMDRLAELLAGAGLRPQPQAQAQPRPNPALESLRPLVGRWEVESPQFPGASGRAVFEWMEGGAYLVQRSDAPDPAPSSTWIIGGDESAAGIQTAVYHDSRGVSRVYRMSLQAGEWKVWREAPGFHQRFVGTIAADGGAIAGRWDISRDGSSWEEDFELDYRRIE